MSRMEKRVRAKRLRNLKRWARVMRYLGYTGATLTGVVSGYIVILALLV